jgi:hypothetical protein
MPLKDPIKRKEYELSYDSARRAERALKARNRRERLKKLGACCWCANKAPIPGQTRCFDCAEKQRSSSTKFRKRWPLRKRKNHVTDRYGITWDDYLRMLDEQGHRCAICKKHVSELTKRLHIDHDHQTERIRGLLCFRCNGALERLESDPQWSEKALAYLNGIK